MRILTRSNCLDTCTDYVYLHLPISCCVYLGDYTTRYNNICPETLCVSNGFWLFVRKRLPFSLLHHQFWYHFHPILPRYSSGTRGGQGGCICSPKFCYACSLLPTLSEFKKKWVFSCTSGQNWWLMKKKNWWVFASIHYSKYGHAHPFNRPYFGN